MIINSTVFGVAPVRITLLMVIAVLTVLLTFANPEVSSALAFFPRLGFWFLHISVGLLAILAVSLLLQRYSRTPMSLFTYLTLTGGGGALLATPVFLSIEQLYPPEQIDDWLDVLALQGYWQSLIAEFLAAFPKLLLIWYSINLPFLLGKGPAKPQELLPAVEVLANRDAETEKRQQQRDEFFSRLPQVIGKDLVAISSDLHYLNVYTTMGKALILGSLKDCVEALGEEGVQVHRSSWVAKAQVTRIHTAGSSAHCIMSNGLRIPISRSNRKKVKDIFGHSTISQDLAQKKLRVES